MIVGNRRIHKEGIDPGEIAADQPHVLVPADALESLERRPEPVAAVPLCNVFCAQRSNSREASSHVHVTADYRDGGTPPEIICAQGRPTVPVPLGNGLSKLFEAFLDDPRGDALIVVESGDLSKASSLRKVFETAANAAAIACYPDSAQGLVDVVRRTLKSEGISISPEALDNAVARLGSDRGVTRSEVEKLTLYVGSGKCAELDDVRAILGNEAEAHVEEVCDAAGEGDRARLDAGLERLWSEGTTATAIVRTVISHFQKVLLARTRRTQRENIDSIIRSMRPPLHFARVNAFKNQVSRWSETRLLQALDLLLETEALCKTTAVPAESACGRALHGVAAMARLPG